MLSSNLELRLAFLAILAITGLYLFVMAVTGAVPAAGELYGHAMGVLGFILMLMTETLYSLRKRTRQARWGKMSSWLQFHIFTGIVGPYLVLLHSSWKLQGLAGLLMLMTGVVVLSGFVGRYIYTAVPRTADGIELEADELQCQIAAIEAELGAWLQSHPQAARLGASLLRPAAAASTDARAIIWHRGVGDIENRLRWRLARRALKGEQRAMIASLERIARRRETLRRQVHTLAAARRMLAVWHTVHIPIGLGLFTLAFAHIAAAVYFATLLR